MAGGGVLNEEAAIDEVLISVFGVVCAPLGGVGIECRLAASVSFLILTSANEVDGPENRFFNVPRNPNFDFCVCCVLRVDSDALVRTDC